MKKLMTIACVLWGAMAIADFNSALDCTDLTFTMDGDAEWFEQSDEVKSGKTALRSGDVSDGQSTWLETTVSGSGMISFWWKVSSENGCDILSVEVDGNQKDNIGGTGGDWTFKTVPVVDAGEHVVCWTYAKDGSVTAGQDCGWLDSVSWTPAPESMIITFETNGGEALDPEVVAPGATYGELAVPEHDTLTFLGWYLDAALTQGVSDEDIIPFVDATLYAKWGIPVETMNTVDISFSTEGGWCVEEGTGPNGEDSIVSYANGQYWNGVNGLSANVIGAGTLTFRFRPTNDAWGYCDMCVNGNYEQIYSNGKWQDCAIIIRGEPEDVQSIEWYTNRRKIALSDFVWTPAPESTTISFETNGAGDFDSIVVSASDDWRYSDILPSLSRDGYIFVGWYFDPEFTKRLDEYQTVGFDDVTLYARWELPVEVMNTDDIKFSASEGSCWYAKESPDANGGYAATRWSSTLWVEDEFLKVSTVGYGHLSLCAKASTDWNSVNIRYSINGGNVHYEYGWTYLDSNGAWRSSDVDLTLRVVPESATSTNEIALGIYNHNKINDILCNFTWTPAPESMKVSFDSAGGSEEPANIYTPGERFGELPVPTREGCTFLGWINGNVMGGVAVKEDELVPFNDVTLVAKWASSEFDALPEEFQDVVFYPQECVHQIMAEDGGSVVEFAFDFGDEMVSLSGMTAKTTCAGYLSFEVGAAQGIGNVEQPVVMIDDKKVTVRGEMAEKSPEVVWTRYHVAIPDGQHDISWLFTAYDFGLGWQPFAWIRNVEFEPSEPQKDVFSWADKLVTYHSWITNDLERFAQSYNARVAEDETDYEARLYHAATVLAQLGESEAVARYASQFGYDIDYLGLMVSTNCERDVSSWPSVNEVVDEAFAVALPVFAEAYADVSAIPLNWSGSIKLAAEKFRLDEDVYLDFGDVMAVRAALEAAIGLLHFAKGYDWTVDYESADAARMEVDSNRRVYKLITEQTNFMAKVRDEGSLGDSKTWMGTAFRSALDAAAFMRARPVEGDMHFFEYDPALADEWARATNLVSKAIASLDGAQEVDVAEEIVGSYGSCSTALLPNDGLMQIYLGALFSGKITQDLRPAVSLYGDEMLVIDFANMKDPTIAGLLPDFAIETWLGIYDSATNGVHVFSSEAVPEVFDDDDVAIALKGSKDPELKKNIVDAESYESYREWAQTVCASGGSSAAGTRAVKGSANTWLSYALGADSLIGKDLEPDDVKIESFSPASTDGSFEFVVGIDGVNVGSGFVEESIFKSNLKKVIGIEGAATLSSGAFSSDNIDISVESPVGGKARLTVTPPDNAGETFFMRVKVR